MYRRITSIIRRSFPRTQNRRRTGQWAALLVILAACTPVPVLLGPRLQPDYQGEARTESGATCQDSLPFIWIYGPQNVRLRVLAREDQAGRAVMVLSAIPFMGSKTELKGIRITNLATGKTDLVAPKNIQIIGTLWSAEFPLSGGIKSAYRIVLPTLNLKSEAWGPGVVELRPISAAPSFLPFNC